MKRRSISALLAVLLVFTTAGAATAISANISPHSQSHAHGVSSNWSLSWGGAAPYNIFFYYQWDEDPGWYVIGTYTTSKSLSHAFWPCTGTVFTQELDVYDQYGQAYTQSHATEGGGSPC